MTQHTHLHNAHQDLPTLRCRMVIQQHLLLSRLWETRVLDSAGRIHLGPHRRPTSQKTCSANSAGEGRLNAIVLSRFAADSTDPQVRAHIDSVAWTPRSVRPQLDFQNGNPRRILLKWMSRTHQYSISSPSARTWGSMLLRQLWFSALHSIPRAKPVAHVAEAMNSLGRIPACVPMAANRSARHRPDATSRVPRRDSCGTSTEHPRRNQTGSVRAGRWQNIAPAFPSCVFPSG